MAKNRRLLVGVALGGLLGGFLSALLFIIAALADGTGFTEAIGYSLIVAILGAFLGGLVGAAVGLGNLGAFGGGLVGLLAALVVVGLYVLSFGRAGTYSYFLSESRILIVGLTTPMILTGSLTALLMNAIGRRS